ncbi:hypothetical protein LDENG_00007580 [Lucifuga dentata]|nr:hypothetical protein LDENG_00007580 [Lucifuga dentata]
MRLKAEVASRSPQKFGRYTVAALEAKIQQYEREVDHLKRALERSDQYIEELESRVSTGEKRRPERQDPCGESKAGSEALTEQQKINMMQRSLSDKERESVCSPQAECLTFYSDQSLIFMPSAGLTDDGELNKNLPGNHKDVDFDSSPANIFPSTPSSALCSLTLKSPRIREKKVAFKPMSYLRRLDFEEFPSPEKSGSAMENQFASLTKFHKELPPSTEVGPSKCVFWGSWQRSKSNEQSCSDPRKEPSLISTNLFQMSSEASMDAAYLDKISELDSMMLEGESSSSRGSQFSLASSSPADLDITFVTAPQTCSDVSTCSADERSAVGECEQQNHLPCDAMSATLEDKETPSGLAKDVSVSPMSGGEDGADVPGCVGSGGPSQTEELSFDLLFDLLEENKAGPSGSLSPASKHHDQVNPPSSSPPSSSSCCTGKPVNTERDRHTLNVSQPTKRKSHSPFNTSSPTKLSKLM